MNKKYVILFYGLLNKTQSYDWIPYGLLYLAAQIRSLGLQPILIHEHCDPDYEPILAKYASESVYFGVSAMSGYQIHSGIQAVNRFRKYAPQTPVIWGGAHATAVPDSVLQSPYADYVCVGPGINNCLQLLKRLLNGETNVQDIPHIHAKGASPDATGPAIAHQDSKFNLAGFPAFPFDQLNIQPLITENRVLNYTASFGCPLNCKFCSWGGAHTWNCLSLDRVLEDLKYLVRTYHPYSLWFSDELTPILVPPGD